MVKGLEVILMRHNQSYDNMDRIIQGQRDTRPADGNEDKLYDIARHLVEEDRLIYAVYTSDLRRAKDHAHLIVDFLRSHYSRSHPDHRVDYFENELLRERARGPLEGARYEVHDNGLTIILEQGLVLPGGQNTQTFSQFKTVDEYLYSLDDPNLGEDRAAIAERITDFRDRYLRPYERTGGKLLLTGHSHWINHARNLLVDGDVASRPFEPLDNLEAFRLFKSSPRSPYRDLNGEYASNHPVNSVGASSR